MNMKMMSNETFFMAVYCKNYKNCRHSRLAR